MTDKDDNPYLAEYLAMRAHQLLHNPMLIHGRAIGMDQPWEYCYECLKEDRNSNKYEGVHHGMRRKYSWAIPNRAALDTIERHSPAGVVEMGAGGGYWAKLLRARGVDVLAFDADTDTDTWALNRWSEVTTGDHNLVSGFPERTLLLCWPTYNGEWTHQAVELYPGQTVIYIGEAMGGCTGTDRMHRLLGDPDCPHWDKEECDCDGAEARFKATEEVDIPQWAGLHDRLYVHQRKDAQ